MAARAISTRDGMSYGVGVLGVELVAGAGAAAGVELSVLAGEGVAGVAADDADRESVR